MILFHRGMLYFVYLRFWKTFSYFSVFRSMFLFLHKYGVEMSRAESPVSSYTCADLAAPNWRRRIGGAELSHSGLECRTPSTVQSVADTGQSCVQSRDNSRTIGHGELSSCAIHTLNTCNLSQRVLVLRAIERKSKTSLVEKSNYPVRI